MNSIGGYFGLELNNAGTFPQADGVLVNSGRNALRIILEKLPVGSEVLVPRFTCEAVYEPFTQTNTAFKFYDVDDLLELTQLPVLAPNQYILYTNYFGIKDEYVRILSTYYRNRLIIDNTQALFSSPMNSSSAFYSPRKFVGVPDGGIALLDGNNGYCLEQGISWDRASHLLKRIDSGAAEGYADFQKNDEALTNAPLKGMSRLTMSILQSVDWCVVRKKRRENFFTLHYALSSRNRLTIPDSDSFDCPMVYPFRTSDPALRQRLISNQIFVATYWPNVLRDTSSYSTAYQLASTIIPLPIDQRYGPDEMNRIIKLL